MNKKLVCALLLAAGATCGIAQAQTVINISGATLLENFFNAPASSIDYIDMDLDGCSRQSLCNDQLAPQGVVPNASQWLHIQYRVVGSVNGFQELIDFGRSFETADGDNNPDSIRASLATTAYHNRTKYIDVGVRTGPYNAGNPGGAPVRSNVTTLQATYNVPDSPSTGGLRIDIAPLDVSTIWGTRIANDGAAGIKNLPGTQGYGSNPARSINKQGGTSGANLDSYLADLGDLELYDGIPANAGPNTVFDTPLAYAPIAVMVNLGLGREQIEQTELRHMSITGRSKTGENIMFVTRDRGSGTRNAFQNAICIDPSWGNGENIGPISTVGSWNQLGPDFQPGNKGSNGGSESTIINHRLAIGYAGAERGVNGAWLTGGRAEVLAVKNDLQGGTEYSRPTLNDVLDNNANGYIIGGPAVLATIGDPRSAPVNKGGDAGNTLPDMRNVEAAAYINNITRSVSAFEGSLGGDETLFTPGELLASRFILTASQDFVQTLANPCDYIENPVYNAALQEFTRNNPNNVLRNGAYQSFGTVTRDGKVPTRKSGSGITYSDGVANGANYLSQGGAAISYGSNLNSRNRIAYDFNGDASRDLSDAAQMIAAWRQRNGGPVWNAPAGNSTLGNQAGSNAIIEVLGDGNGDGNFDAADVRYWADGCALNPARAGNLDRLAGFTAVDEAFGGNFFGTTKATGASYQNGDSAGDVAKADGRQTPGFAPIGADGVINAFDIDYVYRQFKQNARVVDGELNWSELAEAVNADLSADINGDLKINQNDICYLVGTILATRIGDVDLDGDVDGTDLATATANNGTAGGWARGDVNGDGNITDADLATIAAVVNGTGGCQLCCPADFDGDGFITGIDYDLYVGSFELGEPCSDFDGDGFVTGIDFDLYVGAFEAGC